MKVNYFIFKKPMSEGHDNIAPAGTAGVAALPAVEDADPSGPPTAAGRSRRIDQNGKKTLLPCQSHTEM